MQMVFNEKLKASLSPLGFGVMRLDMNADGTFPPEVHALLVEAYERGINYFDTAFPYLGGRSEELVRDALVKKFLRESFYIADKLPVWDCHTREDMERIFSIQLERLGTDYIDFYLLHGLNRQTWAKAQQCGALEFIEQKRKEGRIHRLGFSMHDDMNTLTSILNAFDWEFAQLQINYYDWVMQGVEESYRVLEKREIPCIVMEPVGGGRLAKLPERAEKMLASERPDCTTASWAVRFAAGLPNVAVTLSGMSTFQQLSDNIKQFEPLEVLTEHEMALLREAVKILGAHNTIPCTACRYCVEHCPKGISIPHIFQIYNDCKMFQKARSIGIEYFVIIPETRRGDNCVRCGKCTSYCPQKIDIPKELSKVHATAVVKSIGVDIEDIKGLLQGGAVLVCFGAGAVGRNVLHSLRKYSITPNFFCDNAERLWDTEVDGVTVISPGTLHTLSEQAKVCVIITSNYGKQIRAQLADYDLEVLNGE